MLIIKVLVCESVDISLRNRAYAGAESEAVVGGGLASLLRSGRMISRHWWLQFVTLFVFPHENN